jgi:hypothetical protein
VPVSRLDGSVFSLVSVLVMKMIVRACGPVDHYDAVSAAAMHAA